MYVYRAYYAWYDTYEHIGLFWEQEDAWIGCAKHYNENIIYSISSRSNYRLKSHRWTRYFIEKEEIKSVRT